MQQFRKEPLEELEDCRHGYEHQDQHQNQIGWIEWIDRQPIQHFLFLRNIEAKGDFLLIATSEDLA